MHTLRGLRGQGSGVTRPIVFLVTRSVSSNVGVGGSNPSQYCLELVRRTDHEHYLTNLLLPAALQTDSFAIRAFSSEISGVRDVVSERTLGQMRLQFWRDTVAGLYRDKCPNHPVAVQLYRTIKRHRPSEQLFMNLIRSREQFLSDKPFNSLDEVGDYGQDAFSSVYLILLELMNNKNGHLKHSVTQLGQCEGLITLLRALPYNASKRRCFLPTQLLSERDLSAEKIIRCDGENVQKEITEVIEIIAARAEEHLMNARFRAKHLTGEEAMVMLPCVSADHYLTRLSKAGCNVWDKSLHSRNSWLPGSLYWHKFKRTY